MNSSKPRLAYRTKRGRMYLGESQEVIKTKLLKKYRKKVQLIFTSPPFPLNLKKKYGNLQGQEYVHWLVSFAPLFKELLKPDGSIVMEIGNAWEPKRPVMSVLPLQSLLAFLQHGELNLCQQFVWYNPAKLPTPAQWVNIERSRVKDSYTNLWWMSPVERPKASNKRVLSEYSASMKKLLKRGKYNAGTRPSDHHIGATSFLTNNKGAIPPNVLTFSNTHSNTKYQQYCRKKRLKPHPARMPSSVAEFFIKFLSRPGDLVLDPFAGSNTTGAAAEMLKRRWISIEMFRRYVTGSRGRFGR